MPSFCNDLFSTSAYVSASGAAAWPLGLRKSIGLDETGLVLGTGTSLIRRDPATRQLDLASDRDRCLALLSVAGRGPVAPAILDHVEATAMYWTRGDQALANLRLVFAGLPTLHDPAEAYRLQAAEYLLDEGMAPHDLMKELGLDASALGLGKYDPDQPRVPAGSGPESGRWTDGTGGEQTDDNRSPATAAEPPRLSPSIIQVAADGPFEPRGIEVDPTPPGDKLDPQGLNAPLSPLEQQVIADTADTIIAGRLEDLPT